MAICKSKYYKDTNTTFIDKAQMPQLFISASVPRPLPKQT